MSGGSYNYACFQIERLAEEIRERVQDPDLEDFYPPKVRRARLDFADHLDRVAKAAHDIEWVDSGDYHDGMEMHAINVALGRAQEEDDAAQPE